MGRGRGINTETIVENVSRTMDNRTVTYDDIKYDESPLYDLVYATVALFVATLSALIASFLGFRRQRGHDPASSLFFHGAGGQSHGMWQNEVRV